MSLEPFALTFAADALALAEVESRLAAWVAATHGPTGQVVRWAVVAGPPQGQTGPWRIEGVAGPLPQGATGGEG